eukprot:15456808-Alexandrium_andersonii.AAC.1
MQSSSSAPSARSSSVWGWHSCTASKPHGLDYSTSHMLPPWTCLAPAPSRPMPPLLAFGLLSAFAPCSTSVHRAVSHPSMVPQDESCSIGALAGLDALAVSVKLSLVYHQQVAVALRYRSIDNIGHVSSCGCACVRALSPLECGRRELETG